MLQITSSLLSIRHEIRSPEINEDGQESKVERSPDFEWRNDVSSEMNEHEWEDYSDSRWQRDASVGPASQTDMAIAHGGIGGERHEVSRSLSDPISNTYGFRQLGVMVRPRRGRMAGKGRGMRGGKGGGMRGGKGHGTNGSMKAGGKGKGIDGGKGKGIDGGKGESIDNDGSRKHMMMRWGGKKGKKGMSPDLAIPKPDDMTPVTPILTKEPSDSPVALPSDSPFAPPSDAPVAPPSDPPLAPPSNSPVAPPSDSPVAPPSNSPVAPPSDSPVAPPSDAPSKRPTPKPRPSRSPTRKPKTQAPDAVVAPVPDPNDTQTTAPVAPTDAPVTVTDSPSRATDTPTRTSDAPVIPTEAPTESISPSIGSSESAYPTPTGSFTRCFVSDSPDIGCPDADIGEKCDKFNPVSSFSSCLATCIDAYCCIHDSPSNRATSCSQEKNCVFFDPCYIVWFALHDTIGPAPYIRLNQNEPFFDENAAELQQIFVDRPDFFEQMFGHFFFTDDLPLDDATFVDSNNW